MNEINIPRKEGIMTRWKVKGCPRCGGDMFIDRDLDSWYQQCLQCSYRVELKPLSRFKEAVGTAGKHDNKDID
jgi:ribosomal protein S27AE